VRGGEGLTRSLEGKGGAGGGAWHTRLGLAGLVAACRLAGRLRRPAIDRQEEQITAALAPVQTENCRCSGQTAITSQCWNVERFFRVHLTHFLATVDFNVEVSSAWCHSQYSRPSGRRGKCVGY